MKIRFPMSGARFRAGWTLVEMMFAVGIGGVVMAAVVMLTLFSARSFYAMNNYDDLNRQSRLALDLMSREIRQAAALTSYSTNQLVFTDESGATFSYTYNSTNGTLVRSYGGVSTVVLSNIEAGQFAFEISQRSPSNGFTFYPAGGASSAKLIDMTWRCSRSVLGVADTESMQMGRIVMRN
ncbi:MAG: prepilin-type N-terminal cleavage/methylation domain-containing protein [Verrucomicrobia bacterium]|nr:prepilin-type N-terminal cleavage/methylation domain-containing protein [Verrucomicrobiota bacterium]